MSIGSVCFGEQTFVQNHGQLKVQGSKIVDKNGTPVTLRGMSMYDWAIQGIQFYNADCIKTLRDDWKCTVIRIPILPGNYPSAVSRIKTVVQACIDLGIYAIIDWHAMGEAPLTLTNAKAFFTDMATTYGKTPNVMYELWNEPLKQSWVDTIKPYHESLINVIRPIDPDNIIICGTGQWSQLVNAAASNPITISGNIAYTLHFYAASHKQSLRDDAQKAIDKNVAVFVTEYGESDAGGSGVFDTAETKIWWEFLNKNNIGHTKWSVSALNQTSAVIIKGVTSNGPWPVESLKPSGIFARDYLRAENANAFTKTISLSRSMSGNADIEITQSIHGTTFTFKDKIPRLITVACINGSIVKRQRVSGQSYTLVTAGATNGLGSSGAYIVKIEGAEKSTEYKVMAIK